MKVIVFGATGSVGKLVVEQALEQGHTVTAFCRNPAGLTVSSDPALKLVKGDVLDPESVSKAVAGQEVVCILLGSGKSRKSTIRSVGTLNIIKGMQAHGVKRLLCQTTLGAGDSWGNLNFFWKRIMFGWFLKQIFQDHQLQESYVKDSGLEWTIVRPAAFTDGERSGNYQHGFGPDAKGLTLKIARADIADFMTGQFANHEYLYQCPGLSY